MKFSYNWIRELVDGVEVDAKDLGLLITMKTAECEGVEEFPASGDNAADSIIEIDNKSLTHRPDLWGHHGLAREVAAILRRPLRDPVNMDLLPEGAGDIEVSVADFDLCPRYSGLTFENVRVGPSPAWLRHRLESIGLNPINNIVDVTNFVMAEISEPMHAFDRDTLDGDTIFVRSAREGEAIVALNEESYDLDPSMIVIADRKRPVAIGGVIGGLETAITESTTRMVLEAANFRGSSIRKTSSKLKLRTDASMRFEKAQDPANTVRGLARAIDLFREISPGIRLVGGVADSKADLPAPARIALPMEWLARKLGCRIDMSEVTDILKSLEFGVEENAQHTLYVMPPSWRATRDISIKDDLVEEVGRIIGYDSITPMPPAIHATTPPPNEERAFHHELRAAVSAQGYTEVYNYSFLSEETVQTFGMEPDGHLRVVNPIATDQSLMRKSLVPGLWRNIRENSKHFESFRLFEIGYEIHKKPASLPDEIDHLAAAIYAREGDGAAGLFELKRLAECLMPGVAVRPAEARPFEHPVRAYDLVWRGATAARLFELHPRLGEGRAALLDINLDIIHELGPREKRYHPPQRYPTSAFDLSVIAGKRELAGDIEGRLSEFAGPDLASIEFVREYSGPPLPEDKRSLSYRLTVFAADRTLTAEEASAIRQRIIDGMREAGYELRL